MNELSVEKTMAVKEVAEVLNKDTSTIRKIGKALFPDRFRNGHTTMLNEKEVTAIKLNLGKNSELYKTPLEKELLIQQAMMFQSEKITALQLENEVMKPKALLADQAIRDTEKDYCIRDAGKHIGLNQKRIFEILREKDLLTLKNLPTQKAIDAGILTLKTNSVNGRNRPQSVMTMENILNFNSKYKGAK